MTKQSQDLDDLWIQRLTGLVRTQQQRQVSQNRQITHLRARVREVEQALAALATTGEHTSMSTTEELAALLDMRSDPVVLVRNYGPEPRKYHSAADPCGWVGDQSGYESLLWSEAKRRSLRACSSCGYVSDRAGLEVHPVKAAS